MTARDEYRFYARKCLRWAEETDNEERRQGFLNVAKIMMQLAMRRENEAFVRVKDACALQ